MSGSNRNLWIGRIAAIGLAIFACSYFLGFDYRWDPEEYGRFGFYVGADWRVNEVNAGSSAAAQGISIGDTVIVPDVRDRLVVAWALPPRADQALAFRVVHAGRTRNVALRAIALEKPSTLDRAGIVVGALAGVVGLAFGLLLVLLKPSAMTWGFYFYSAFALNWILQTQNAIASRLPVDALFAYDFAGDLLGAAALVGFLIFCIRFPDVTPAGWRAWVDRDSIALYAIAGICFVAPDALALSPQTASLESITEACMVLGMAAALAAFVSSFRHARLVRRQKMAWVALGMVCTVATFCSFILNFEGLISDATADLVCPLAVVLPLTVAYAIVRHRVVDVRFAISRSLFFAIVAAALVALFSAIDWLFTSRLPSTRIEAAAYVAVGLLSGVCLSLGWRRLADAVDFVFFRPWFERRRLYNRVADAIRDQREPSRLRGALVDGAAEAFSLSSTALFEAVDDGGFIRTAAVGWPRGTIRHIFADDRLVERVRSARPIDLDAWEWSDQAVPAGTGRPVMSIPVTRGRDVVGFLLIGAHRDGTAPSPDEGKMLRSLCGEAANLLRSAGPAELIMLPASEV